MRKTRLHVKYIFPITSLKTCSVGLQVLLNDTAITWNVCELTVVAQCLKTFEGREMSFLANSPI